MCGVTDLRKVFQCTSRKGKLRAVKVAFDERGRRAAERELDALTAIPKHQNLIHLVDFHASSKFSALTLPLYPEGDSLQLMMRRRCTGLPEDDVRRLFVQLVDVVVHIHAAGFIHRDIKCENILLGGPDGRMVVLADLGFAGRWRKGEKIREKLGSPHYSSPEVVAQIPYEGPEVDVWAMGVVLYAWVCGRLPFGGHTDEALASEVLRGNFYIPLSFSANLRDLITRIFEPEAERRITVAQIRSHPWLTPPLTSQWHPSVGGVRRNVSSPNNPSAVIDPKSGEGSPRSGRSASLSALNLPAERKKSKGLGGSAIGLLKFFTHKEK